jgi:hypothetical protein
MIAFLIIALTVLGIAAGFYTGMMFQHKNDLLQARTEVQEEYNQMGVEHGASIARADGLEQELGWLQSDLAKANVRIRQLESMMAIPMKRMPTGSLNKSYRKKQEAEKTDSTPTDVLPTFHTGDLPPMQIL